MKYDLEYDEEAIEMALTRAGSEVGYAEVYYMMERVSERLRGCLPVTAWEGLVIVYDPEAHSRKNRRHILVSIRRRRHKWWVVDVFESRGRATRVSVVGLSDKKDEMVRHVIKMLEKSEDST